MRSSQVLAGPAPGSLLNTLVLSPISSRLPKAWRAECLRTTSPLERVQRHFRQKARQVVPPGAQAEELDVEQVGSYAIRIHWNDGHSAGIYSYEHFRDICPCLECRQ